MFLCFLRSLFIDLAKTFGIREQLPNWTHGTKLKFTSVTQLCHFQYDHESRVEDEADFLDSELDKITGNPSYCSPLVGRISNAMRADVIAVGGIDSAHFFSVLISNKLYNEKGLASASLLADEYSTDWDRVYHHASPDEKGNTSVDATAKRRKWDEVLAKHSSQLKHQGSLRLHVVLPHIQAHTASSLCRVQGNDIIIYVDKENANLLFDHTTCELLAEVTKTEEAH